MQTTRPTGEMQDPQLAWHQLAADYQQMCWLKRQGKHEDANRLLNAELPQKIAAWSRQEAKSAVEKKAALEQMFRTVQERVNDAYLLNEMLTNRWREELMPMLCGTVAGQIQKAVSEQFSLRQMRPASREVVSPAPRLAFDNIPGIIDLIQAEERRERPVCASASA